MSETTYFLKGKKVGLRAMTREDLKPYKNWLSDENVTRYLEMGWRPYTDKDLEATYQQATESQNTIIFVVCDIKTGQPIGTAGLYLISWPCRRAQFNILLGEPTFYGKGYGTETAQLIVQYSFERLNLNTIYLGVNAENVGAIKSYEKAGFIKDGVHRDFVYNNGRYYNSVAMSILKADYSKKNGA